MAVYNYKDGAERRVFKDIAEVVLRMLSLPISNGVVERVFSIMNIVKTKSQNRMKLKTLESILRIRLNNYARGTCCQKTIPTQRMLELFTSNMYNKKENDKNLQNDIDEVLNVLDEAGV